MKGVLMKSTDVMAVISVSSANQPIAKTVSNFYWSERLKRLTNSRLTANCRNCQTSQKATATSSKESENKRTKSSRFPLRIRYMKRATRDRLFSRYSRKSYPAWRHHLGPHPTWRCTPGTEVALLRLITISQSNRRTGTTQTQSHSRRVFKWREK